MLVTIILLLFSENKQLILLLLFSEYNIILLHCILYLLLLLIDFYITVNKLILNDRGMTIAIYFFIPFIMCEYLNNIFILIVAVI